MRRGVWLVIAAGAGAIVVLTAGCVHLALPLVSTDMNGQAAASPAALGAFEDDAPISDIAGWTERRAPQLRAAFEREIYGRMPPDAPVTVLSHEVIDPAALDGAARLEQARLRIGEAPELGQFSLALLTPTAGTGPFPTILAQSFCGNRAVLDRPELAPPSTPQPEPCDSRMMRPVALAIFGAHIMTPPLKDIISKGYAFAILYAAEVAPDNAGRAGPALAQIAPEAEPGERPGAIAAWAWAYLRAIDYLDTRSDLDPARTAIWGHSRNGKSALLAAAFDERVDLVISHQSGTGGATLSRSHEGESIAQITNAYPHWFGAAYAGYDGREEAIPVDQHQLIALIAPRPVLFGNAWRDKWSDPNGAYRAIMGADPVYELFGARGLDQAGMTDFAPDAELSFFLRSGNHGVTRADWRAFLAFLDAHFAAGE
ncbi:MAG: hypothetical protein MI723_14955 [Caulobacterales bacterium]|nr:hypothetical protein [Caulobacterales bacterium]